MALDINSLRFDSKPALVFDAEAVTLTGHYLDELGAYRARREWMDILNSFFLLEKDRDYEMEVVYSESDDLYFLDCVFVSACGRYAFWRLINNQAPEAENRLGSLSASSDTASFLSNLFRSPVGNKKSDPWVISAPNSDETPSRERKPTLIGGILDQFRKLT